MRSSPVRIINRYPDKWWNLSSIYIEEIRGKIYDNQTSQFYSSYDKNNSFEVYYDNQSENCLCLIREGNYDSFQANLTMFCSRKI